MVSSVKIICFSFLLFFMISSCVYEVNAIDETSVSLVIAEAEKTLESAYNQVIGAEKAGANVSDLLTSLNLAGAYLSNAYLSLSVEDYENATRLADLSIETANDLDVEASLLKMDAERMERENFLVRVLSSFIGVVIVVISGVIVWFFVKKKLSEPGNS